MNMVKQLRPETELIYIIFNAQALDGKFVFFYTHYKCQSINYNSVKFQVARLQNKKVTIYRSALSYKQLCIMITQWDK